ncbi:MAG: type I 3-dehydroquinate dehydratase, partial [Planctomycetes bacterium]|nr:type I 3-dehydroquinate dehydratase [Planctomycetota bacterium]
MICVSLGGLTPATVGPALAAATAPDTWIEIRLDLCPAAARTRVIAEAARLRPVPLVATCRAAAEGGRWSGDEAARRRLLERAARAGFAVVDVELGAGWTPTLPNGARLMLSHHDFVRTPPGLPALVRRMERAGAGIVKVAVTAERLLDNLKVAAALRAARVPACALAMGELGRPSRILYKVWGGFLTYAAPDEGAPTAPGQLRASELRHLYRAPGLSPRTRVYGLLGWPIGHSRSPAFFNARFAAAGRDAVYVPFPLPDGRELARWLAAFPAHGYSVTLPHKEAALAAADRATADARAIGAANTLRRRGGAPGAEWAREACNTAGQAARAELEAVASAPRADGGAGWGGPRPLAGRAAL